MRQLTRQELEIEPMLCSQCNGSGEGMTEGSRCSKCKGLGELDLGDANDCGDEWDTADYYYECSREED